MSNKTSKATRETQTIGSQDVGSVSAAGITPVVDRTSWVDLPIGFDPYWKADIGKSFVARVAEFDARDPKFVRIRFRASERVLCAKGDTEHAEDVWVEEGGYFTISCYAGIAKELMYHYQSGICPEILLTCVRQDKVKTGENAGKPVWIFSAKVRPEDQRKLAAGRDAYFKALAGGEQRPQLAETSAPA